MPTDTFYNLDAVKKQSIFDAAVSEFAARRFSEASINQIVRDAGISRGSFYQYFDGKEDLYLYVLGEIGKEKMSFAFPEQTPEDADFYTAYIKMVKNILAWARERPLFYKIGALMEKDDSAFIARLQARVPDAWSNFRQLIERDKELGRIRRDVDSDLMIHMLIALNMYFLRDFYETGDEETMLRQVEDLLKIIWGGIANV
ncbi:MAG: TetR/AcrR family transcriptional regulator [Firmicutes bacterium]|nr:TetR/AcrR family transcriptional regulator [Bacillota bacterium]